MAGYFGSRARTAYPLKKGGDLAEPLWLYSILSSDSDDGAGSTVFEGTKGRCTPRQK